MKLSLVIKAVFMMAESEEMHYFARFEIEEMYVLDRFKVEEMH